MTRKNYNHVLISNKSFGTIAIAVAVLGIALIVGACTNDNVVVDEDEPTPTVISYDYECLFGTASVGDASSVGITSCSSCDDGYKIDGSICVPTVYACANGTQQAGSPAGNVDVAKCIFCDAGYKLLGDRCVAATFTCENGAPQAGSPTRNVDEQKCSICNAGYKLIDDRCVAAIHTCKNGVAAPEAPPGNTDEALCISCDSGYLLENDACIPTKYTCQNGTPSDGSPTGNADVADCASCHSGYKLILDDNSCVPTSYSCENGTVASGSPSGNADAVKCDRCDSGYKLRLDDNSCVPTVYTCSDGAPPSGSPEGNADVEKCSACQKYHIQQGDDCIPTVYTCKNGRVASRSPALDNHPIVNDDVTKCTRCNTRYRLENGICVRTTYICENGTPLGGSPQTQGVKSCAKCDSGYRYILSTKSCVPTVYTCENGEAAPGSPKGNYNVPKCQRCDSSYKLKSSDLSCVPTIYTCENGRPPSDRPAGNSDVAKCAICDDHYSKVGDRCEVSFTTTMRITGASDTTIDTEASIKNITGRSASFQWILYTGRQQSKTHSQVTSDINNRRGVDRSSRAKSVSRTSTQHVDIDSLDAKTTYTLYIVVGGHIDFLVFTTQGSNSKYGVDFDVYCRPRSKIRYIPDRFRDSLTGTNGIDPAEEWVPNFNELGQLPNGFRAQRECYKHAYYYKQTLPDTPPRTTSSHTNSLPSGMFYDKNKYKLVFEEDFGPNTSSNPHNTHNKFKIGTSQEQPVNLHKIFEGLQNNRDEELKINALSGHGKASEPIMWPGLAANGKEPSFVEDDYTNAETKEIRAALQNEWAWPAYIKNGRLYAGLGRVSLNHVGNNDIYYCRTETVGGREVHTRKYHDFDTDPYSLNGRVDSCECDADTDDGCTYFFGSWDASNIKYQYGFLEIDIAEMMLSVGRDRVVSIYDFIELLSHTKHSGYWPKGSSPRMLSSSIDENYLELWPVELQLMEHFITSDYRGRSGWWLVKHYYPRAHNRLHSRFYHTYRIDNINGDPRRKVGRKLGIEWTPAGYKMWESLSTHGGNWVEMSKKTGFRFSGACEREHQVNGFIQCGISHVTAAIKHSGAAGTAIRMTTENPRYVFNHIRLYQPEGNYEDVQRVYK